MSYREIFYIGQVEFPSFRVAAHCAITHARQRNMVVKVKNSDDAVLAEFVPGRDNTVSICATERGKELVENLA